MNSTDSSAFQNSALSLEQKLETARAELLDLGARNRLLNIPRSKNTRFLEIIDERSEEIYKLLINENKSFTFLHGKSGKDEDSEADDIDEKSFIYQFDENSTEKSHNTQTLNFRLGLPQKDCRSACLIYIMTQKLLKKSKVSTFSILL
jgi:hypothetical protein